MMIFLFVIFLLTTSYAEDPEGSPTLDGDRLITFKDVHFSTRHYFNESLVPLIKHHLARNPMVDAINVRYMWISRLPYYESVAAAVSQQFDRLNELYSTTASTIGWATLQGIGGIGANLARSKVIFGRYWKVLLASVCVLLFNNIIFFVAIYRKEHVIQSMYFSEMETPGEEINNKKKKLKKTRIGIHGKYGLEIVRRLCPVNSEVSKIGIFRMPSSSTNNNVSSRKVRVKLAWMINSVLGAIFYVFRLRRWEFFLVCELTDDTQYTLYLRPSGLHVERTFRAQATGGLVPTFFGPVVKRGAKMLHMVDFSRDTTKEVLLSDVFVTSWEFIRTNPKFNRLWSSGEHYAWSVLGKLGTCREHSCPWSNSSGDADYEKRYALWVTVPIVLALLVAKFLTVLGREARYSYNGAGGMDITMRFLLSYFTFLTLDALRCTGGVAYSPSFFRRPEIRFLEMLVRIIAATATFSVILFGVGVQEFKWWMLFVPVGGELLLSTVFESVKCFFTAHVSTILQMLLVVRMPILLPVSLFVRSLSARQMTTFVEKCDCRRFFNRRWEGSEEKKKKKNGKDSGEEPEGLRALLGRNFKAARESGKTVFFIRNVARMIKSWVKSKLLLGLRILVFFYVVGIPLLVELERTAIKLFYFANVESFVWYITGREFLFYLIVVGSLLLLHHFIFAKLDAPKAKEEEEKMQKLQPEVGEFEPYIDPYVNKENLKSPVETISHNEETEEEILAEIDNRHHHISLSAQDMGSGGGVNSILSTSLLGDDSDDEDGEFDVLKSLREDDDMDIDSLIVAKSPRIAKNLFSPIVGPPAGGRGGGVDRAAGHSVDIREVGTSMNESLLMDMGLDIPVSSSNGSSGGGGGGEEEEEEKKMNISFSLNTSEGSDSVWTKEDSQILEDVGRRDIAITNLSNFLKEEENALRNEQEEFAEQALELDMERSRFETRRMEFETRRMEFENLQMQFLEMIGLSPEEMQRILENGDSVKLTVIPKLQENEEKEALEPPKLESEEKEKVSDDVVEEVSEEEEEQPPKQEPTLKPASAIPHYLRIGKKGVHSMPPIRRQRPRSESLPSVPSKDGMGKIRAEIEAAELISGVIGGNVTPTDENGRFVFTDSHPGFDDSAGSSSIISDIDSIGEGDSFHENENMVPPSPVQMEKPVAKVVSLTVINDEMLVKAKVTYSGGKEGKSMLKWFRVYDSGAIEEIPEFENQPLLKLGKKDIGCKIRLRYTPVRVDGEMGESVTATGCKIRDLEKPAPVIVHPQLLSLGNGNGAGKNADSGEDEGKLKSPKKEKKRRLSFGIFGKKKESEGEQIEEVLKEEKKSEKLKSSGDNTENGITLVVPPVKDENLEVEKRGEGEAEAAVAGGGGGGGGGAGGKRKKKKKKKKIAQFSAVYNGRSMKIKLHSKKFELGKRSILFSRLNSFEEKKANLFVIKVENGEGDEEKMFVTIKHNTSVFKSTFLRRLSKAEDSEDDFGDSEDDEEGRKEGKKFEVRKFSGSIDGKVGTFAIHEEYIHINNTVKVVYDDITGFDRIEDMFKKVYEVEIEGKLQTWSVDKNVKEFEKLIIGKMMQSEEEGEE